MLCKFSKYQEKIFLPTSCVEKDLLWLPEIYDVNVSFIQKIHNVNFSFRPSFIETYVSFNNFKIPP